MSNTARATTDIPTAASGDQTIGVRLPPEIIEALKVKRSALAKDNPGVAFTISDAVRALLHAALSAEGMLAA